MRPFPCWYCKLPVRGVWRGEHLVPEALGGKRTSKTVCKKCNNEVLSVLVGEVGTRSPIAFAAAKAIRGHLVEFWDIDHDANGLLLDAAVDSNSFSPVVRPQVVIDVDGPRIHGGADAMQRLGFEDFERVVLGGLRRALIRWAHVQPDSRGVRPIRLHRVAREGMPADMRYPPRFVALTDLMAIRGPEDDVNFELRYCNEVDKRRAVAVVERLHPAARARSHTIRLGSRRALVGCVFRLNLFARGLVMLAVNVLFDSLTRTPVGDDGFALARQFVLGRTMVQPPLKTVGLLDPRSLDGIHDRGGGHAFRLWWSDDVWWVAMSFFGGAIAAGATVPGPNCETWRTMDVVAPLRSRDWIKTPHALHYGSKFVADWNLNRALRSLGFNFGTQVLRTVAARASSP